MSHSTHQVQSPAGVDTAGDYLLPKPPTKAGELVVAVQAPAYRRHREAAVARGIGKRALAVAECQQHLFGELRDCLTDLEQSIGESTRVRLQTQVRTALSVLEWCEAVLADQFAAARLAASGQQPIEVLATCEAVAARWRADGIDVVVDGAEGTWWGDGAALEDVLDTGLRLVRERAQGACSLTLVAGITGGRASVAIAAVGEPHDDIDAQIIEGFRDAVARVGGMTRPGRLGSGGTGLCVELPGGEVGG